MTRGGLPAIGDFVADGRLRIQTPDRAALEAVVAAARQDVAAAESNLTAFPAWAETMLYEAGLRCARVIVQAAGYRIAADRGHVTAIDAADSLTQGRHHRRFVRLHRMRRQRHEFMYETAPDPSRGDLKQALQDVDHLLRLAVSALGDRR
jgi:hypothetical protein